MEWNKPIELNYRNLKAVVELPEHKLGFTAVAKYRNKKFYIEPFKPDKFKSKTLYVVAFTHYYLEDYKGKKTKWYNEKYTTFMAEQPFAVIDTIQALTVGGWWNTQEHRYNVDLGAITTSRKVARYLIKKYKQLAGWDLIKEKEV